MAMIIRLLILLVLLSLSIRAANPSFGDFDLTQFRTNNNKLAIKSGALQTNGPFNALVTTNKVDTGMRLSADGLSGGDFVLAIGSYADATLGSAAVGHFANATNSFVQALDGGFSGGDLNNSTDAYVYSDASVSIGILQAANGS